MPIDVEQIRSQFPVLDQEVNGKPLVYFDNAASSQRPRAVIDAVTHYEERDHSNVHRGVHTLSQRATVAYEAGRASVQRFLNAAHETELVFTRGTTEAINLVASAWGRANLGPGDVVLLSEAEHHSNIVPWQLVTQQTGATIRVIPLLDDGSLDYEAYASLLDERVKMVAVGHVSNALGTVHDIETLIAGAHSIGAKILLDGAQGAPHATVDVQALDVDFYCFSSHKVYGPTGMGVLYGKEALLEAMPPYQGGGEMIDQVSFEGSTWAPLPAKFEAGTPNISGAVGLGAALDWMGRCGVDHIAAHEQRLLQRATEAVQSIDGLTIVGTAPHKAGVLSFTVDGVHPTDIGTLLDQQGVAVRTGHHCAQPVMRRYGVSATARASFAVYNTDDEVDRFVKALAFAVDVLR